MIGWLHIILIAAFAGLILVLVLFLIFQRFLHPKTRPNIVTLQNGIARLHQVSPHCNLDRESSINTNCYVSPHGDVSKELFFSWGDHPSLVADAVENGWPRFCFTTFVSFPSASDYGNETSNVEISWEVCEGSSDYMQKIRLKNIITSLDSSMGALSVIRTALPLPGPRFGISYFPQEAYFEITILPRNEDIQCHLDDKEVKDKSKGDRIKLIGEDFNTNNNSESLSSHSQRTNKIEEVKQEDVNENILVSIGLRGGGHLPLETPGSFPGSIGFNSSGSVYLNGTKLVFESEKDEWGNAENVIGCGYNPSQKKVIFTVNSQLVHEIHCKTEEFGYPLYPTIAANTDIMVLVNLGQIPFKFEPVNLQRTPNPCFIRPQLENSAAIGYEDSKELFSMGRIDSKWRQWSATTSNNNTVNSIKAIEFDQDSESDLFEICLG